MRRLRVSALKSWSMFGLAKVSSRRETYGYKRAGTMREAASRRLGYLAIAGTAVIAEWLA